VPIVAKWLLVFEDPVSGVVTLGWGLPRECLEDGRTIGVKDAPTRWGKLSYAVTSNIGAGRIDAEVTLPEGTRGRFRLRLRAPRGHALQSARRGVEDLAITGDCVVLPSGNAGPLHIVTNWSKAAP